MQGFDDRVALITGGTGGLGRAMGLALANQGTKVMLADRSADGSAAAIRAIEQAGGTARFTEVDVTDSASVAAMVEQTVATFGRLDFAINNAGIDGGRAQIHRYPIATWHEVIAVNLTGVFLCMQAEIPRLLGDGGVIVNIASVAGLVGYPGSSAYSASKHGVVGLTKTAALEYVRKGIRVNAICPGYTRTPMVERIFDGRPELETRLTEAMPIGRIGRPEEIAEAVVYLCSERTAFMIGHALVLDGGLVAQ